MRSPFLIGDEIYLRPLEADDADGEYGQWLNDADVCAGNSHHVYPKTKDATRQYIEDANRSMNSLVLAIVLRDSDKHVGNVCLQNIHPINRSAELAILIGDRDSWGTGIGFQATKLIVGHGFQSLNLHRIYCGTFSSNRGMQRLATKLGMTETGRQRQAVFKNGQYIDIIQYDLLASEFTVETHGVTIKDNHAVKSVVPHNQLRATA